MGMCEKLKWNRKRLMMTQKEFGDMVGLSATTICKLERDETAWGVIQADTADKIASHFEKMSSWQPERADKVLREINEDVEDYVNVNGIDDIPVNLPITITPATVEYGMSVNSSNDMTREDLETLTLMEFGFEGLFESTKHEEFVANMNIIRRIVNKYYIDN